MQGPENLPAPSTRHRSFAKTPSSVPPHSEANDDRGKYEGGGDRDRGRDRDTSGGFYFASPWKAGWVDPKTKLKW